MDWPITPAYVWALADRGAPHPAALAQPELAAMAGGTDPAGDRTPVAFAGGRLS